MRARLNTPTLFTIVTCLAYSKVFALQPNTNRQNWTKCRHEMIKTAVMAITIQKICFSVNELSSGSSFIYIKVKNKNRGFSKDVPPTYAISKKYEKKRKTKHCLCTSRSWLHAKHLKLFFFFSYLSISRMLVSCHCGKKFQYSVTSLAFRAKGSYFHLSLPTFARRAVCPMFQNLQVIGTSYTTYVWHCVSFMRRSCFLADRPKSWQPNNHLVSRMPPFDINQEVSGTQAFVLPALSSTPWLLADYSGFMLKKRNEGGTSFEVFL